jgi:hypothetical protein
VTLKKFAVTEEVNFFFKCNKQCFQQTWEGNADLLGIMSHLKHNLSDIVTRDKDRIFMVTVALPDIAEFSTRKTFCLQVLLSWEISTVNKLFLASCVDTK